MRPVVLHIPHSSRFIAPEVRATLLPSVERIEHELLILTDAWTDQIVEGLALDAKRIIFPVSRLVVDPERFSRDEDEPMAKKGMGATYTKLSSGETLRVLSKGERRQLMETYYYPHHASLTKAVGEALAECGSCLIVDVHSFSGIPLPHEPDQAPDRAEVCIGFDDFHSAFERDLDLLGLCNRYGFEGSVNRPFSGSIVPSAFWNQEAKVRSFMIELRRDLYMDEQTGRKRDDFCAVSIKVCELLRELSQTK